MKVQGNPGVMLNQIRKQDSAKSQGANTFHQIMEGIEKGIQNTERSQGGSGIIPEGVQIVNQTGTIQPSETGFERGQILKELEQTLDLIDYYAGRLADPSFQIREMESLVDHLEERMAGFQGLQSDAELPEQLRSIISDMVLTLGKETAKFRRGDYS